MLWTLLSNSEAEQKKRCFDFSQCESISGELYYYQIRKEREKPMKVKRKIIQIHEDKCDGCGFCVPSCAEGAIQIIDGKAKLVADKYCDGLGACLGECPRGALTIVERVAEEFDEESVATHIKSMKPIHASEPPAMACGCPSALIQSFMPAQPCTRANEPVTQGSATSMLSHWPVQIRLVPSTAPFLKNADLLIAADCTPIAYPRIHDDFLKGRVVLLGCPKFDDTDLYVDKFADIFRDAEIRSVSMLVMEVPCCQGLPVMIKKGMEKAGKNVPLEKVVIARSGEIVKRELI